MRVTPARLRSRRTIAPQTRTMITGTGVVALILVVASVTLDALRFDVIIGVLTLLSLVLATIPLLRRVTRSVGDPAFAETLYWALGLKFVFTLIRYFFIAVIYNDNGDAGVYSATGAILMELYRKGTFTLEAPGLGGRGLETARISVVVGLIYVVTGVSRYAASFVFSWLCFLGQLMMFRAFHRGVPEGDLRRYGVLIFFLPSLLFWPSSIGKEALMIFFIGFVCYGAAQLLGAQAQATGVLTFLAGAAGLFYIRPHMALISIVALAFAAAVSTVMGFSEVEDKKANSKTFAIRMTALALLIIGGSVATTQLSKVFGDGTDSAGVTAVLDRTKAQTSEGGSQFAAPAVTSPQAIPWAVVTVLLRPFVWEAHNANGMIAASEGVLFIGLLAVGRRRLVSWAHYIGRRPYLVFASAYAMTFIIAFSYIGNFGILARQRTQMIPLALTLLAMPVAARKRSSMFGGRRRKNAVSLERQHVEAPLLAGVAADSTSPRPDPLPRSETQP